MTFTLDGWVPTALFWLIRIGVALLLFYVGGKYARKAREMVKSLLRNPHFDVSIGPSIPRIAGEGVYIALWVLIVAIALILLGVPATFVITAVVVLLALVVYALRESLSNLAATVIFAFFQPFRKGETIETNGFVGAVYDKELFNTVLLTSDQRLITLPNAMMQSEGIINYSRMGASRVSVDFLIAYGQEVDLVRKAVIEVMAMDDRIAADPAASVSVTDLGVQGIRMMASATVAAEDRGNVPNDLREAIVNRLTKMGVDFPELPLPLSAP